MADEPIWLRVADVIEHNRDLVAITNEPHQILNLNLLESACERPRNMWFYAHQEDLPTLAVEFMLAIAKSHPFLQGNKRTGFVSGVDFLELNGFTIEDRADEALGWFIEGILIGQVSTSDFVEVLLPLIKRVP